MDEEFYYQPTDAQFSDWLENFTPQAETNASIIGYSASEIAKLKIITAALGYCDERSGSYENARLEFIGTRQIILNGDENNKLLTSVVYPNQVKETDTVPEQAPPNAKAFIQNLVQRARICPELNDVQKKEMGILPKPKSVPTLEAVLKGQLVNGRPVLECKLLGTNGFEIWRRVTGAGDFEYFDRSADSSYTDDSALPQGLSAVQYDYQARLIGADNEPVTEFSNTVTLTKTA